MNDKLVYISRRRFFKNSALATAMAGLPAWFIEREMAEAATPRQLAANEKPGIALVGCGGQGSGDCGSARRFGNVLAVCDVDAKHAEAAAKRFTAEGKAPPAQYRDFRKVMERDDIHVVITGTPDHWHTLVNLAAVKAGKDVYSEKPLTLTIDEGKRLVQAVKEHKAIFQVGSQQRSDRNFRLACELVRNGRIGKLRRIIVGLPTGPREGPFKPISVPQELDWDFYLGQTPKVDFNGHNHHWNFRWWYQFSGGQMTDWGAHHNDIAQWGNDTERSGPIQVNGHSLMNMIPGGYDAAAEYYIKFKYANGVSMIVLNDEVVPNGIKFVGANGWIFVTRGKIDASKPELLTDPLPEGAIRLYKSDDHMGNFFECVRSRKAPICEAEIGHRSISIAHLGVISIRMGGAQLNWNPEREEFTGENASEANRWLSREMRKPYDYSFIA